MHTGIKGRQVHPLIRFLLRSRVDEKSADLHKAVHLCFVPGWHNGAISGCPSHQRFPWALQLREQILKEQITDDRVFFKMPFRPCPSGCGRFLSADDGHDRCLQCLGRRHAEAAFVDDLCVCCGRMSMISLRSRLSFMKGLAPSAATRADLSGSSRGSPADALGDLRVTVRASPPGTPPRTSYSSRSEHPIRFPGDFAGLSHGAPSISFGAPSVDRMSIAASGDGFTSSEDEGAVGLPPSGVVATATPDHTLPGQP